MDCAKMGSLISDLRKEKRLTQKQLAETIHVSDKAISKWERGLGCPDVSLLPALSAALGINIEGILEGDLNRNRADTGNLRKMRFYVCPACGNILTSTGEAQVFCCGRRLMPMVPRPADEEHRLKAEQVEDDLYLTFSHEMSKEHYLNFVACVGQDRVLLIRLYPEQGGELRFPLPRGRVKLYCGCTRDGLWVME